jgi:hypothetical protein
MISEKGRLLPLWAAKRWVVERNSLWYLNAPALKLRFNGTMGEGICKVAVTVA